MTLRQLEKINDDLIIASTMISLSINDEQHQQLVEKLEQEELIKYESDLNFSATNLLEFAIQHEIYEAASVLNKILKKLNK